MSTSIKGIKNSKKRVKMEHFLGRRCDVSRFDHQNFADILCTKFFFQLYVFKFVRDFDCAGVSFYVETKYFLTSIL